MDPKNDFELDISMEAKCRHKLRSSLKKRKSKNPLGSLDITDVNADNTIAPPQRRVSFASSNYVKPFIDDPEKNTIWDNTYEEEVNHTDSTKSDNTNHPHLSDLGSHCQEVTNVHIHKECITNIYCDPSVVNMEVSYFDQTLVNDKLRYMSSESDLDITPAIAANVDVKNITQFSKETTINMELTCQWKNNIMQSSNVLKNDSTTNRNYLLGNCTVSQEEDMSMTCCFNNDDGGGELCNEMEIVGSFSNKLLGTADQSNKIASSFTRTGNVKIKEHKESVYAKKDEVFSPDQSGMEFTCAFPNNILETNQLKETNKSPTFTAASSDVESKENIATVYTQKDKVFFPDQSEMEFTCAFPNNILETNQLKETINKSPTITVVSTDVESKENIATVYTKKNKVFFPDQSEMEFTCAFPNNILETNQLKETINKSPTITAVSTDVENKENIATVYTKKDKVFFPDQSEMEFTCAFPNNILETNQLKETKNKFPTITAVSTDFENKENIATVYTKKNKVFFPDQTQMEFTCAFPNSILETNQVKETINKLPTMTALSTVMGNKENIDIVYAKKDQIILPDQSEMQFHIGNNILETSQLEGAKAVIVNVQNKENIPMVYTEQERNKENIAVTLPRSGLPMFCDEKDNGAIYSNSKFKQTEDVNFIKPKVNTEVLKPVIVMEFGNIPVAVDVSDLSMDQNVNYKLVSDTSRRLYDSEENKETKNKFPSITAVSTDIENKENIATVYTKKDKVFFPDQTQMEFTCAFPNNILETSQLKETINTLPTMTAVSTVMGNKENIDRVYAKKDQIILPGQSEMQFHIGNNILETSQLEGAKAVIVNVQNKENIPMVYTEKERNKENIAVTLPRSDLPMFCDENDIYSNSKFKHTEDVNFIKPKVNTEVLKPVKVMEFGNIPVAVDVSDLSMDQNVVSDTSRRPYDSKENTYTVSVASSKKTKLQFLKDPLNQSNKEFLQDNQIHSNESGENVIDKSIRATDIPKESSNKKQNKITLEPDLEIPVRDDEKPNNELNVKEGQKQDKRIILSESQQIATLDERQNQISRSPKEEKIEYICAEECTLIESMEGSILINSSVPDEEPQSLDVYLPENRTQNEASLIIIDEDCTPTARGQQLCEKIPATKVIYSEPMKGKPFHDEFPSMQTSGLNPFDFTSIASVEDTQQLIQATFSKPSLVKTDQWEGPECTMLENSETNSLNKSDSVLGLHDETRNYQSVFRNIHKKLSLVQFPHFNYGEVVDSIRANRELRENMEEMLLNFKFPEIGSFTLQKKTIELSQCNTSGDRSESMLDGLEYVENNNFNKSMSLEPIRSLQDKIVDVCTRSNKVLKIKYFKGHSYVFSTMCECVLIYVHVHPEDDRVTEIKAASSLNDCMDPLNHFLIKTILDKLKHSTLKLYLGPYYDVLSLLDHICLMVDEVKDFHFEFLSLQKLHPSLKFTSDYRHTSVKCHKRKEFQYCREGSRREKNCS